MSNDYALPYGRDDDGNVHRGAFDRCDALGPAGGINASVEELIRYVAMHLDAGRYRGRVVLAEQDALEMQTPQIVVPDDGPPYPEMGPTRYGLGFYISTYRDHKQVRHDGGLRGGFSSIVSFLPDDKIGAVVLSNISSYGLTRIVTLRVFDRLLGLSPVPWSDRAREEWNSEKASADSARRKNLALRKPDTHPSHSLAEYAGTYAHPAYGTVAIRMADLAAPEPSLVMDFHGFTSALHHFHDDVFDTPADKRNRLERTRVRFETDGNGAIARLGIPFEPSVADIVFEKCGQK